MTKIILQQNEHWNEDHHHFHSTWAAYRNKDANKQNKSGLRNPFSQFDKHTWPKKMCCEYKNTSSPKQHNRHFRGKLLVRDVKT